MMVLSDKLHGMVFHQIVLRRNEWKLSISSMRYSLQLQCHCVGLLLCCACRFVLCCWLTTGLHVLWYLCFWADVHSPSVVLPITLEIPSREPPSFLSRLLSDFFHFGSVVSFTIWALASVGDMHVSLIPLCSSSSNSNHVNPYKWELRWFETGAYKCQHLKDFTMTQKTCWKTRTRKILCYDWSSN